VIVYTRFTYDANNRRTTQTRPEGERITYFYNEINQVRSVVYGGGHQVEYRYNGLGLPDTVKYYGPSASNLADKTVRYDYDVNGNLLSYTDGTTSADYVYDDLHRKISETVHYPHFSKTYTVDFPDNWHIDFTGPDGVTVTSSYDAGMRLSDISVPGAGSFDFTNYDWARPQTITLPTNTTIHKSYDALMRTTGILVQDSANTQLMSRTLSYDKVGNLLAKQTEHGLYSYSYDELNRLTDALNPGLPDEHFTYDPLGNRLTDNGVSGPLSYNRNNELTSLGGVTLSYDDNGNMVANNWPGIEQRYVYDETKRLKQIKDPTGAVTAEYYYDPFGRRLWKEVDGARTYFMYSGEGLIAEFDDNGTQTRGYGYAMGSTWTTNPLWLKEGGDYYFYLNDHLGTPQKIIDAAGEVVWSARYDSFGNAIIDIDTISNPLRFPGQYYDEESGLHYNWNRYYDPFLGRYIQSDPLGLDAGINFFVYAGNRPLTVIDPWGLEPGDFYDGSGYGKYGEEDTGQGYQSGGYADSPGYGEGLQSGWQYRLNPSLAEKNPSGPLAASPVVGGHEGKSAQQIAWEKLTPEEQRAVRAHRNAQRAAQRAAAKRAAQGGGVSDYIAKVAYDYFAKPAYDALKFAAAAVNNGLVSPALDLLDAPNTIADYVAEELGWDDFDTPEKRLAAMQSTPFPGDDAVAGVLAGVSKLNKAVSGQMHHGISKKVHNALQRHPNLRDRYKARDSRFQTQGVDIEAHRGYQSWHRDLDEEVSDWVRSTPEATTQQFESYLIDRYSQPDLSDRFPNGF
jgi:RHS repeat-associated protein